MISPLGEKLLRAVLVHHPGGEDHRLRVGVHPRRHAVQQLRGKGNIRVAQQMVFTMQQGQHHVVSPAEAQVFRLGQQAYIRKALRHARRQAIATMVVHHENFGPRTAVLQALERFQGLLP